jgi:hypothetical protein
MRFQEYNELRLAHKKAKEHYENLMRQLPEDPAALAQEANDAWLQFKRLEVDFKNSSIVKKMEELFSC